MAILHFYARPGKMVYGKINFGAIKFNLDYGN